MLRSYAISACQQFATSYGYIIACLWHDGLWRFRLDLCSGRITPARYDYYRNRCLTDRVTSNFQRLLLQFPHVNIQSAWLTCDVYAAPREPLIETRVAFVASDGRRWQGGIRQFGLGFMVEDRKIVIPRGDNHRPAIAQADWRRANRADASR